MRMLCLTQSIWGIWGVNHKDILEDASSPVGGKQLFDFNDTIVQQPNNVSNIARKHIQLYTYIRRNGKIK